MLEKYPIDFEQLKFGDVFTETDIIRIFQVQPGTPQYEFKCLHLKQLIEERSDFTARISKNMVLVLTPEQASEYNDKEHNRGLQYARRRFRKMVQVDTQNMTLEDERAHTLRLHKQTFLQQAITTAKKRIIGTTETSVKTIG